MIRKVSSILKRSVCSSTPKALNSRECIWRDLGRPEDIKCLPKVAKTVFCSALILLEPVMLHFKLVSSQAAQRHYLACSQLDETFTASSPLFSIRRAGNLF